MITTAINGLSHFFRTRLLPEWPRGTGLSYRGQFFPARGGDKVLLPPAGRPAILSAMDAPAALPRFAASDDGRLTAKMRAAFDHDGVLVLEGFAEATACQGL